MSKIRKNYKEAYKGDYSEYKEYKVLDDNYKFEGINDQIKTFDKTFFKESSKSWLISVDKYLKVCTYVHSNGKLCPKKIRSPDMDRMRIVGNSEWYKPIHYSRYFCKKHAKRRLANSSLFKTS